MVVQPSESPNFLSGPNDFSSLFERRASAIYGNVSSPASGRLIDLWDYIKNEYLYVEKYPQIMEALPEVPASQMVLTIITKYQQNIARRGYLVAQGEKYVYKGRMTRQARDDKTWYLRLNTYFWT